MGSNTSLGYAGGKPQWCIQTSSCELAEGAAFLSCLAVAKRVPVVLVVDLPVHRGSTDISKQNPDQTKLEALRRILDGLDQQIEISFKYVPSDDCELACKLAETFALEGTCAPVRLYTDVSSTGTSLMVAQHRRKYCQMSTTIFQVHGCSQDWPDRKHSDLLCCIGEHCTKYPS